MQKIVCISILWLVGLVAVQAQTTSTIHSKLHLPDSVKLQAPIEEQKANVADMEDEFLLDILAQQTVDLALRDSLLKDSLLNDLVYRDSVLNAQLLVVRDSIYLLRKEELARIAYEDSIRAIVMRQDSMAREIAAAQKEGLPLLPSLVKDAEEDLNEMRSLRRNIFSPWRKDAIVQAQISETYITENWYQGGEKFSFSTLLLAKGNINYNKGNVTWENLGEWRMGVTKAPSTDTVHRFNVTDDIFRLYSKFGYQVVKSVYVSSSAEFKTSLWNAFNTNATTVKTAFLTPIRYNMDLGIDYKPKDGLSVMVAPLAYKMVYAHQSDPKKVSVKSFGIAEGKNILNDVGSSVRVKWNWKPLREVVLNTEFYIYTNYKKVEVDWQTDCNFIINRFMSVRLTLHPRFDNTVILAEGEKAKLQFKNMLSVGFAHKFQ